MQSYLFDRTSCITPNGWVTANVGGLPQRHHFCLTDLMELRTSTLAVTHPLGVMQLVRSKGTIALGAKRNDRGIR